MDLNTLKNEIEGVDIYLLDQILKNRYTINDVILDAGCGKGRNLKWFYTHNFEVYGVDTNSKVIDFVKEKFQAQKDHFMTQHLKNLSFEDNMFDHIICNAVLHFAQNKLHFFKMLSELVRVLKKDGTIFIRMANIHGIEELVTLIDKGVYKLPDKSNRFLLTNKLLTAIKRDFDLELVEPFKYVHVANKRSMATFVLKKTTSL